jgi:hypothetical protein
MDFNFLVYSITQFPGRFLPSSGMPDNHPDDGTGSKKQE